jgi:hypothetical protein
MTDGSRVMLHAFLCSRVEVDVTLNAGYMWFGVREAGAVVAPADGGIAAGNVLVASTDGYVRVRGEPEAPASGFEIRAGETFTLRLDRVARAFCYIVRGVVSPAQFTDLSEDGRLDLVAFLPGWTTPPTQFTVADVRVDAGSDAAAAPLRAIEEVRACACACAFVSCRARVRAIARARAWCACV